MFSPVLFRLVSAIKLYLLGLKVLVIQLFSKRFELPGWFSLVSDGKVAIVTGGGRGIGYEVARHMAKLGARVIIGTAYNSRRVLRTLFEETLSPLEFKKLDLASLQSVRQFVQSFKERDLPLNILVNNAGVMLVPEACTENGFELHFGVNYLGHFLLTCLLLDTLKLSGKSGNFSRVVNVSSSAHRNGEIRLNDLNCRQRYSAHAAYCHSKLAQLIFSSHLHRELEQGGFPVSSCAVDPGMVDTSLYRHLWTPLRLAHGLVSRLLFRTPTEGAATVLYAALSPTLEGKCGGGYWANGRRDATTPLTFDPEVQQLLWETSQRLLVPQ
uniref:Dehydrogenase/reductase SDR family member on chromosome X-like n=1 Tax=Hippocampus comes TaxID=109280 RepID=A0A3Q2XPE7_HIPCM